MMANTLTTAEEVMIDEAFLLLAQLRDRLARRYANIAACRVDEAIEKLQIACRVAA